MSHSEHTKHWILLGATSMLVLLAVWLCYAPGLSGGFLFDDENNLKSLGAYGPIDDWLTVQYYLTSGIADPTGRPVAVASFLLDARNWPADPLPFKRTNVLLHLLNGLLLFAVISRLERRLTGNAAPHRAGWIALLAAALWMAHPLFVSTTLYVVQRHAMLPLTFLLCAMLCWDLAFSRHVAGARLSAWLWGAPGLGLCFVLAGLSKPNGMLAPLLLWMAFIWFYRTQLDALASRARRQINVHALLMLAVPAIAVLVALALRTPASLDATHGRDFTFLERLLTQPRALLDYLYQIAVPRAGGGGVFVEDFAKSTSLWNPSSTLPAIALVIALVVFAVLGRKRWPAASFAIGFFFAAHLVESSVIMLELYFEHRNYVPAAFLFWPVSRALLSGQARVLAGGLGGAAMLALLLTLAGVRAADWGDPSRLSQLTATFRPDSIRAQVAWAAQPTPGETPHAAANRLAAALDRLGPDIVGAFNLVEVECRTGSLSDRAIAHTDAAIASETRWNSQIIGWLRNAMGVAARGDCGELSFDQIESWIDLAEANPAATANPTRSQNLAHLRGVLALHRGQAQLALSIFNRALGIRPNADTALLQAALLGEAGHPALGLEHLDSYQGMEKPSGPRLRTMQQLHAWLIESTGYYQREIEHLTRVLEADLRERQQTPLDDSKP